MVERVSDYDYFIAVTNYLDFQCRLRLPIGSNDFHLIFDCWEKGIPLRIVCQAIEKTIARKNSNNKPIRGFSDFSYQIHREFKNFIEKSVGAHFDEPQSEGDPWKDFFERLPGQYNSLRKELEELRDAVSCQEGTRVMEKLDRLLELFSGMEELQLKTELFSRSLAPAMRKESVIKRYRLSFLINYLKLPIDLTDWPS